MASEAPILQLNERNNVNTSLQQHMLMLARTVELSEMAGTLYSR